MSAYKIKKLFRFILIYGLSRAIIKSLGRLRLHLPVKVFYDLRPFRRPGVHVGLVGAGQHAFSSIAYFLSRYTRSHFDFVIDPLKEAGQSFAVAFSSNAYEDLTSLEKSNQKTPNIVYIASNHSSHVDYATYFINKNCDIFIEKPIAISLGQLSKLDNALKSIPVSIFAGYNRPFSPAIARLKSRFNKDSPLSLNCSVVGHFIPSDHWYRDSGEGTRVVANIGHWIDLAVHLLFQKSSRPTFLEINYCISNPVTISDNVSLTITSSHGDLINIFFTSRGEPFEGVSELILFQQDNLIAKIYDFRKMEIWSDDEYKSYKYAPKDNGHKNCILQPFFGKPSRPWPELYFSTRLMLDIEKLALSHQRYLKVELP